MDRVPKKILLLCKVLLASMIIRTEF